MLTRNAPLAFVSTDARSASFHSRSSLPTRVRPLSTRVRLYPRAFDLFSLAFVSTHARRPLSTRAIAYAFVSAHACSTSFHSRSSLPTRVRPLSTRVSLRVRLNPRTFDLFPLAFVSTHARSIAFHSRMRSCAQTSFTNSFSTLPYWKFTVNRVIDPEEALMVQSAALFVLNSCG